jgi:hypothetical protein
MTQLRGLGKASQLYEKLVIPAGSLVGHLDKESGNRNNNGQVIKIVSSSSSPTKYMQPGHSVRRCQNCNGSTIYEAKVYVSSGTRPP